RYRSIVFALAGDSTIISVLAFVANAAAAFDADPPAFARVPRPAAAAAANASPPPRLLSPLTPRANARALDAIHPRAPRVVIPIEARARRVAVVEVAVAVDSTRRRRRAMTSSTDATAIARYGATTTTTTTTTTNATRASCASRWIVGRCPRTRAGGTTGSA
ncbi:MAG: hypothetical protein QF839_08485, partial [Candidatus Poseidoniaceae archaeon]|nr:hypothetical protein [Candidatus Poseidoniaceae archaeon]